MNASELVADGLHPLMDGMASNHYQQRLIQNDTPELDSALEFYDAADRLDALGEHAGARRLRVKGRAVLVQVQRANAVELECQRTAAGVVDRAATELQRDGQHGVNLRKLGDRLARALDRGETTTLDALLDAHSEVALFSPTVCARLGRRRVARLRRLLDDGRA